MSGSLHNPLEIQQRVIGALILREMHTRFGRENLGYLWLILEPMILAGAVALMHIYLRSSMPYHIYPAPFWIVSYGPWIMFRSMVLRSDSAIEANKTLLYHRIVTLLDIHLSRGLLEFGATTFALVLLLGGTAVLGIGNVPERPLLFLEGMALLWWMGFGLGLVYSAWAQFSNVAERFMHPALYLALPFSGVFTMLQWFPQGYIHVLLWFPIPHIVEIIREGQFATYDSPYVNTPYVLGWCVGLTFVGLATIKTVRRTIHLT